MGRPDPQHPDQAAEALADLLRRRGVSIAGAGTTIDDDESTVGEASRSRALATSLAPVGSPASKSLLEAYRQWQQRQAAAEVAAKASGKSPESIESAAMRSSAKRLAKHLREGMSPAAACAKAHERYKVKGGRSGFSVWARRISSGT